MHLTHDKHKCVRCVYGWRHRKSVARARRCALSLSDRLRGQGAARKTLPRPSSSLRKSATSISFDYIKKGGRTLICIVSLIVLARDVQGARLAARVLRDSHQSSSSSSSSLSSSLSPGTYTHARLTAQKLLGWICRLTVISVRADESKVDICNISYVSSPSCLLSGLALI